jgi:phenylpyruvate tautomerase PptA (4-oxalocrotonate tautomerase family)
MAQIKIYGRKAELDPIKRVLSDLIHACVVEALSIPPNKRFHRFFPLDDDDFVYPDDRSSRYLIIELSLFEGRSLKAKKQLIRLLFQRIASELGIAAADIEIHILETPKHDWGIRGLPADELELDYRVDV